MTAAASGGLLKQMKRAHAERVRKFDYAQRRRMHASMHLVMYYVCVELCCDGLFFSNMFAGRELQAQCKMRKAKKEKREAGQQPVGLVGLWAWWVNRQMGVGGCSHGMDDGMPRKQSTRQVCGAALSFMPGHISERGHFGVPAVKGRV